MSHPPRVAVCSGSFDPITVGHEDIVRRSLGFCDRVIVAVAHQATQTKRGMFSVEERVEMIRELFADEPRVEAAEFQGLLIDFARARGATLIVRGLRTATDFEYEAQMARMNGHLSPGLDTVFLAAAARHSYLSATLVREIASLGGDVSHFVSPPVLRRLRERTAGERR